MCTFSKPAVRIAVSIRWATSVHVHTPNYPYTQRLVERRNNELIMNAAWHNEGQGRRISRLFAAAAL